MDEHEKTEITQAEETEAVEQPKRRRGGRRPMTPEEKQAAAEKRAEEKAKAGKMEPVICVQYQDREVDVAALLDAAKAEFRSVKKRLPIRDFKLYIKPEEQAAYYVINGEYGGKIDF